MNLPEHYLARALGLAERGRGRTSPNPMVGAVLVREGRIIGEGYHARCGERHAEVAAIEDACGPVAGAALYCTLEPCCQAGPAKRTPPCTERIIREGIGKVVLCTLDPNPLVSGRGVERLKQAGIQVVTGYLAEQAAALNEAYFTFIRSRLPFVHLKVAQSLDGRIATCGGDSRWITDREARTRVHRMRCEHDAVLVGRNTVLKDDPALTVRLLAGRQPLRVVLDERLEIPESAQVLADGQADKTCVFIGEEYDQGKRGALERRGVRFRTVSRDEQGRLDLAEVLRELGRMEVSSVLVEGGAGVFTGFIRRGLFDKISVFIAPLLIGKGTEWLGELAVRSLDQAVRLETPIIEVINGQVLVQAYRRRIEVETQYTAFQKMREVGHVHGNR
jgi:diaminohydroxyphosphoribosylaminopyrimidine deaminase/5-amino-6-(5-phosphoribosylamino)uracil reductase